jgi:hypothetical protein
MLIFSVGEVVSVLVGIIQSCRVCGMPGKAIIAFLLFVVNVNGLVGDND